MLLRLANKVPIDFAFPTRNLVGARPKIGTSNTVDLLSNLNRDVQGCEMVDGNGCENNFDKDNPPRRGDVSLNARG